MFGLDDFFRNHWSFSSEYAYPETASKLHETASLWYQKSGDIDEAVHHALAAGNIDQTADILEDYWQIFFFRGELTKLKNILDSLGSNITNHSVILRMAYSMIFSQTGAIGLIPNHSAFIRKKIKDGLENEAKQSSNLAAIPSLFETMEAIVALDNGEASKAKEHAKKAISLIPENISPVDQRRLRLGANFRLGQALKELDELEQACSVLLEVLEMLKAIESFYVVGTAIPILSIYQELGRRKEALELCKDTLGFINKKHWVELPLVGILYISMAGLQADAGDFMAAQGNLEKGRGIVKQQITPEVTRMIRNIEKKLGNFTPPSQHLVEALSPRECEVLQLIAQGFSNREISERLYLALSTVKGHNRNIFEKLNVQRRTEAVARAQELGLL